MSREPCDLRARWLGGPTWCHTHDLPADHAASISMDEIGHDGSDTPVDGFGMTGERQSAETALSAATDVPSSGLDRALFLIENYLWNEDGEDEAWLEEARDIVKAAALPASTESGSRLEPARLWQLALARSIEGLVTDDAWEAAAAIKGRLDSRGVVLAVDADERDRLAPQALRAEGSGPSGGHTWAEHIDCDPASCTVGHLARSSEPEAPEHTDA